MTAYNLYDTIQQSDLDDIIDALLANFHLEIPIDLSDITSEYADITLHLNTNQSTGTEYLINSLSGIFFDYDNPKYKEIDYYLLLEYYDLGDGDIDDTEDNEIKTKLVPLEIGGRNFVEFDEAFVYLQHEATLIITNEEIE